MDKLREIRVERTHDGGVTHVMERVPAHMRRHTPSRAGRAARRASLACVIALACITATLVVAGYHAMGL